MINTASLGVPYMCGDEPGSWSPMSTPGSVPYMCGDEPDGESTRWLEYARSLHVWG